MMMRKWFISFRDDVNFYYVSFINESECIYLTVCMDGWRSSKKSSVESNKMKGNESLWIMGIMTKENVEMFSR